MKPKIKLFYLWASALLFFAPLVSWGVVDTIPSMNNPGEDFFGAKKKTAEKNAKTSEIEKLKKENRQLASKLQECRATKPSVDGAVLMKAIERLEEEVKALKPSVKKKGIEDTIPHGGSE